MSRWDKLLVGMSWVGKSDQVWDSQVQMTDTEWGNVLVALKAITKDSVLESHADKLANKLAALLAISLEPLVDSLSSSRHRSNSNSMHSTVWGQLKEKGLGCQSNTSVLLMERPWGC